MSKHGPCLSICARPALFLLQFMIGVAQPAILPALVSVSGTPRCAPVCSESSARGVGHPEQSRPDVRRTDATSWQYRRPAGVTFRFQVSEYSIDPSVSNRSRNLLSKDRCRMTLADNPKPRRPEMSTIIAGLPFSRDREGLTGTGSCPNRPICRPLRELKREFPSGDSGKEMASGVLTESDAPDFPNISFRDNAISNQVCIDQIAQPLSAERIVIVVVVQGRSFNGMRRRPRS